MRRIKKTAAATGSHGLDDKGTISASEASLPPGRRWRRCRDQATDSDRVRLPAWLQRGVRPAWQRRHCTDAGADGADVALLTHEGGRFTHEFCGCAALKPRRTAAVCTGLAGPGAAALLHGFVRGLFRPRGPMRDARVDGSRRAPLRTTQPRWRRWMVRWLLLECCRDGVRATGAFYVSRLFLGRSLGHRRARLAGQSAAERRRLPLHLTPACGNSSRAQRRKNHGRHGAPGAARWRLIWPGLRRQRAGDGRNAVGA